MTNKQLAAILMTAWTMFGFITGDRWAFVVAGAYFFLGITIHG